MADRFNTFHDFALAELDQIYTPEEIDETLKYSITELNSGVFINDGKGAFKFKKLPKLAQLAPGYGIIAQDFDGDNIIDLLLAQNFHWPQVETGRMSGSMSLLLKGKGDGTFDPLWPHESGIIVPDDAKSACLTDFNGDSLPDVVIASNDGPVRGFSMTDNNRVKNCVISLEGIKQNIQGVGSRVTATYNDGLKVSREVKAGSGYLSQSTSKVFFSTNSRTIISLKVDWPNGKSSEHRVDKPVEKLTIKQF